MEKIVPSYDPKYDNISPLDSRYRRVEYLEYLSERAFIRYKANVEFVLAKILWKRGLCTLAELEEISEACRQVTAEEVYAEEDITRHDIRALVNCIQRRVKSDAAKSRVHMTATSFDVISSALAARDREVMLYLVLPALKKLEQILIQIAIREASTVQIGRTHGQHAVPITFGFMIAGYVSRLGRSILKLEQLTGELHAKFSGAVGSYNASSLILDDPEEFEREILAELGVKPAECATQIAPHEEIVRLLNELTLVAGIMDDMANDLRQLQRTEISEVGEEFAEGQVGSSTMPQKRNPVNLEKVCSIFKIVMPRILTAYLNIRSEHQRDLTGSAAERTNGEMFAYVMEMTNTLIKVLKNLRVDRNNLKRNLNLQNGLVLAEPLYIIMAFLGHPDAHEVVRKLTLLAQKEKLTLTEAMTFEEELLRPYIEKMSEYQKQLLSDPDMYIGKAKEKAINVALRWNEQFGFDIVTV